MPMCPEVAISVLAVAKIGAVIIPLFSGYGPEAIATRLRDGEAKVLICADGFYRRGQVVAMKETADRALVSCPTVKKVIVHRHVAAGRHDGALRGHTGPPRGRPTVADGRQAPRQRARRFPHARAQPDDTRRRDPVSSRPVEPTHPRRDRGALEPGAVSVVLQA